MIKNKKLTSDTGFWLRVWFTDYDQAGTVLQLDHQHAAPLGMGHFRLARDFP